MATSDCRPWHLLCISASCLVILVHWWRRARQATRMAVREKAEGGKGGIGHSGAPASPASGSWTRARSCETWSLGRPHPQLSLHPTGHSNGTQGGGGVGTNRKQKEIPAMQTHTHGTQTHMTEKTPRGKTHMPRHIHTHTRKTPGKICRAQRHTRHTCHSARKEGNQIMPNFPPQGTLWLPWLPRRSLPARDSCSFRPAALAALAHERRQGQVKRRRRTEHKRCKQPP